MRVFDYHETERMDATQPISFELEETLRELEMLNARFGGHGYVRRFLQRHLRSGRSYRVLDLATGGGDFPRVIVDWARPRGIQLTVDAIDANGATLELAYKRAQLVEWLCAMYIEAASVGTPRQLTDAEMQDVVAARTARSYA